MYTWENIKKREREREKEREKEINFKINGCALLSIKLEHTISE